MAKTFGYVNHPAGYLLGIPCIEASKPLATLGIVQDGSKLLYHHHLALAMESSMCREKSGLNGSEMTTQTLK